MSDFHRTTYQVPLLLASSEVPTPSTFPVVSPATGKTIWSASAASLSDVNAAVNSCTEAFSSWSRTRLVHRRDLLYKLAAILESKADELATSMKMETGAADEWAQMDVRAGVGFVKELAGRVTSIVGTVPESADEDRFIMVKREPYGVVLAIAPWNAPLILSLRAILFPLAVGNTVILKASELSPRTHHLIAESIMLAGFPPGTVNTILHARENAAEITTALISHPVVKKLSFTGSTAVGRIIAETAGKYLKPCLLELGGKASVAVLDDADIEKAAKGIALGAFLHAGQICMSSERILVDKSIYTPFLKALCDSVQAQFGQRQLLITSSGARKAHSLVSAALRQGAKIANEEQLGLDVDAYLKLYETNKSDWRPTEHPNIVLTNVTEEMEIYSDETFGPVVVVIQVDGEKEAVTRCNHGDYGLSAGVWTRDMQRGLRIAAEIESGAVHINGPTVYDEPNLPHGGLKSSGFGRFGGSWGIDEFLTTKTVTFKP